MNRSIAKLSSNFLKGGFNVKKADYFLGSALRAFSSTTQDEINAKKLIDDVNKLDLTNHDGVAKFGEEKWKYLIDGAVFKANLVIKQRNVNASISSLDSTLKEANNIRITAGLLHETFRDMSKFEKNETNLRYMDLFTSAVSMELVATRDPLVANWIFFTALLTFIMVVVGGLTRLTKSGLSMVHWKFTGEKRPVTDEDWEKEFDLYKQSPEYKLHNSDMTMSEFKFIYHMEFGHRSLGRIIGLVFALPFAFFLMRGRISLKTGLGKGLMGCLGLGALQGGIGWWMVKSGLNEETNTVKANVSPYRLATHLITAFALFTMLIALGLRAKNGRVNTLLAGRNIKAVDYLQSYTPNKLAHILATMVFVTAASGAFVAGNEAGLLYNEFPLMGGQFIPDDIINPYITPAWKNITENGTMVQFTHRCLAITTFSLAIFTALRTGLNVTALPKIQNAANLTALAATGQAALGISTLLMGVPIPLAAAHQAGAMILLGCATRLMFLCKNPVFALGNTAAQLEVGYTNAEKKLKEDIAKGVAEKRKEEESLQEILTQMQNDPSLTDLLAQLQKEQATVNAAVEAEQEAEKDAEKEEEGKEEETTEEVKDEKKTN